MNPINPTQQGGSVKVPEAKPVSGTTYDESVSLPVVTNAIVIRYDKRGNCVSGDGDYLFKKRNGNKVAHVLVRKNGSHVSR